MFPAHPKDLIIVFPSWMVKCFSGMDVLTKIGEDDKGAKIHP